jgi:hypothetical protein
MIPKEGDTLKIGVTVLNEGPAGVKGGLTVDCSAGPESSGLRRFAKVTLKGGLAAGQSAPVEVTWKAPSNGWWRLEFSTLHGEVKLVKRIAVVKSDVYFAWFGAPKDFRWCNVPTTVAKGDEGFWLQRGAIPCAWKGAECYKDWPVEKFVEHYADPKWIAIDEIGGPGPSTDKFMQALKQVRQTQPGGFAAVWTMGAHKFWADVQDRIDLFIPEIYLNYRGNHLGQFDAYIRTIREAGVMQKTIAGLGINIVKDDKTGMITCSPTQEDVLRQIRYLKRIAPDMPGVGFFTSNDAAAGVAEYADELCGEYYIKPVLTLPSDRLKVTPELARPGSSAYVHLAVRNVGNMDCAGAVVWICPGATAKADQVIQNIEVPRIRAGETRQIEARIDRPAGIKTISAHIIGSGEYTVLDGDATAEVIGERSWPQDLELVSVPAVRYPRVEGFAFAPAAGKTAAVYEVAADGKIGPAIASAATAGGEVGWRMPGTTDPGQVRCFALRKDAKPEGTPPEVREEGGKLVVATRYYRAVLDTPKDELASLAAAGSDTEILGSPWTFACEAHTGIGSPSRSADGCALRITIPFSSPSAEGESVYVFRSDSPYIEIARRFKPKGEITLTYAGERCNLPQRGGTYALQPGIGGPVSSGKLSDGTDYRDLLFGYLGEAPSPYTAKRCGWLDMSYDQQWNAGLGVAVVERWEDAASKAGYDLTRLYDASDWIEVPHIWNIATKISREQRSRIFLLPHGYIDMTADGNVPPAEEAWEAVRQTTEGNGEPHPRPL